MGTLNLKQGEKKIIAFIIKDKKTKQPISLTGCTLFLRLKNNKKTFNKEDSDFDKSEITKGIAKVTLDSSLAEVGRYNCQLQIDFPNGEIDKSDIFIINITEGIL